MNQITKGIISLALILMFTFAFIAAQARANLPAEIAAAAEFGVANEMGIILDTESLERLESLPNVVDTILALPIDIALGNDELSLQSQTPEDRGSDSPSVQ